MGENILLVSQNASDPEDQEIREWIMQRFQKKLCMKFVPDKYDEEKCWCGRPREVHHVSPSDSNMDITDGLTWDPEKHLKTAKTNAYGVVEFREVATKSTAKYIRLHSDIDVKNPIDLLLDHWRLPRPELLISIISDTKAKELDEKLSKHIANGLSQVTKAAEAWIITHGTNTRVTRYFADKNMCIGIAPWGSIYNRKQLGKVGGKAVYQKFSRISNKNEHIQGENLDKHHTHFFLVDDGYVNKPGGELKFRANFESAMHSLNSIRGNNDTQSKVPIIRILLGGGSESIKFTLAELKRESPVPVVIISESGKAADILAYAHRKIPAGKRLLETGDQKTYDTLKKMIDDRLSIDAEEKGDLERIFKTVLECMRYKDYIYVWQADDYGDGKNLHEVLMTALFQKGNLDADGKLKWAILMNRKDFAKIAIETANTPNQELQHNKYLLEALVQNKPAIANFFLENGVDIGSLEISWLDLYKKSMGKEHSFLSTYMTEKGYIEFTKDTLRRLYSDCMLNVEIESDIKTSKYIFHQLFLWAILSNMPEMAYELWSWGDDPLRKCLIGKASSKLMVRIGKKRKMADVLVSAFEASEKKYDNLGLQLLNECFNEDQELTKSLLCSDRLNSSKKRSSLKIAAEIEHEEFVAHNSSQDLLDTDWNGYLDLKDDNKAKFLIKFFLCIIYPPVILTIPLNPKYRGSDDVTDVNSANEGNIRTTASCKGTMKHFQGFYTAPITKFYLSVLWYVLFLILFTYVVAEPLAKKVYPTEWILFAWIVTFTIEEIRQIIDLGFKKWRFSYWNWWDVIAIALYFVGFAMRMANQRIEGRIVYAIDLMFFIVRILETFLVDEDLGPYVVMIGRMTGDLLKIIYVALVFMFGYGISRDVILNPDTNPSTNKFFERLLVPYFEMFGELFIEYPQSNNNQTFFNTWKYNDVAQPLVVTIMAIYLLIANVLLLSILIAIFNNTYDQVQKKADVIWRYRRYQLIKDYETRPILPPPLNILCLGYSAVQACHSIIHRIDSQRKDKKTSSKQNDNETVLDLFEERCLHSLLQNTTPKSDGTVKGDVAIVSSRLEEQRSVLTQLAATNKKKIATNHELITKLEGIVEDLRKKVDQTNETGDKLIKELDSIKQNEEQIYQNQLSYNSEENDRKHIVEALVRLEDKADKIHGRVSVSDMWNTKVRDHIQPRQTTNLPKNITYQKGNDQGVEAENDMWFHETENPLQPWFEDRDAPRKPNDYQSREKPEDTRDEPWFVERDAPKRPNHYLIDDENPPGAQLPPYYDGRKHEMRRSSVSQPNLRDTTLVEDKSIWFVERDAPTKPTSLQMGEGHQRVVERDAPRKPNSLPMGNQRNPSVVEAPGIPGGRQLPNRQLSSTGQSNLTDNTQKMGNQRNPSVVEAPGIPGGRQLPNRQLSSTGQSNLTDNTQKMGNQRNPSVVEAPGIPGGRQLPNRQLSSTGQSNLTDNTQKIKAQFSDDVFQPAKKVPYVLSRKPLYSACSVQRAEVSDENVSWQKAMPEYDPPEYTSVAITTDTKWADKEIENGNSSFYLFNAMDGTIDRRSSTGIYEIVGGLPRNPVMRTGLKGRGILGRYGPNHTTTAVFTRVQLNGNKEFLEVLVMRGQNEKWMYFPQGIKDEITTLPEYLTQVFSEDVLLKLGMDSRRCKIHTKKLAKLINEGMQIYQGYLDDERNTDNAWLETVVYNYHDDDNIVYKYLLSDENKNFRWMRIDEIEKFISKYDLQIQAAEWLATIKEKRRE